MKKLKLRRIYKIFTVVFLSLFTVLGVLNTQVASADCYQYSTSGTMITSATPVFNNFCNVPYNIGNESNFVRIRTDVNGNDMDNQNNPVYSTTGLSSSCAVGTKFDLWNYLHNNASTNYNPDVNPSNPSAVAQNVKESLSATLGQGSVFNFGDTVTASNAATISGSTFLNCGNNKIQLSIVPGSVHVYSLSYGWQNMADGTINGGPTSVGSPNLGSGSMWGCWDYRIVIVYQVQVTAIPTVTINPVCNLITIEANGMVAKLDNVSYSAGSGNVTGVSVNFGDGGSNSLISLSPAQALALSVSNPYSYVYTKPGNYTIQATINSNLGNFTSTDCTKTVVITTPPTPPTTPPVTPPQTLVNTGPGDTLGLFFGSSILGTVFYKWYTKKSRTV